jgi:hypothetical protein
VEVDAQGRAWGPYLRAKVLVDISKPLLRCITIFSEKRQTTDLYDVKYEKLPNYCYSCGIIGHSSVECSTPANGIENGLLPYGRDLRALDDNKQKRGLEDRQSFSTNRSLNSRGLRDSSEGCQGQYGTAEGSAIGGDHEKSIHDNEALSPLRQQNQKGKNKIGEDGKKSAGKDLVLNSINAQGTKRKHVRSPQSCPINSNQDLRMDSNQDAMALVVANPSVQVSPLTENQDIEVELDEDDDEMTKKMRMASNSNANGSAEVAWQPRREP